MEIRRYKLGEEVEIWTVFYGSMRSIVSADYTEDQIATWAPKDKCMAEWSARLAKKNPFVAVIDSAIVGFAELEPDGHIDCFYCHKNFQRQGVGSALLAKIEAEAFQLGLTAVFAEVSVTALPFFAASGFIVTKKRENMVCAAPATQYLMVKKLAWKQ